MILKKGPFKYVKHDCSIQFFDKKIKPYPNVVSQTSYKIYFFFHRREKNHAGFNLNMEMMTVFNQQ